MIETDSKKQRDEEFTEKHTLTPADFKRMIAEKMERAKFYSFSYKERERRAELVE
jgi:uncharacterized protein YfeS